MMNYANNKEAKNMNVLFSCDNRIYKYIPSLMTSLYENNPDIKIDIYLMHCSLSVDEINILRDFANSYKQQFFEISVNNNDFDLFKKVDPKRLHLFPTEAYYHFLAHEYLPLSVERILYLDIDTICAKNIINWYNTDFSNHFYVVIGTYDKIGRESRKIQAFNSGVFLININKFRQEEINKDFYKKKIEFLLTDVSFSNNILGDQELIGYMFSDRQDFVKTKQDKNAMVNYQPIWNKKDMLDNKPLALENLGIIHYNTRFKPWKFYFDDRFKNRYLKPIDDNVKFRYPIITENVLCLFNLFWKYSKSSPFYKELLDKALARTDELAGNLPYFEKNKKIEMLHEANLISSNFDIPIYNDYNFTLKKEKDFIELQVEYYIKEQWIIFKLPFNPKTNSLLEFEIDCKYKTNEKIYLFLSDIDGKTQHLPVINSNQYCQRIVCNSDYRFLCLSSNSFKNRGDYIRFYSIVVKSIYEF